MEGLELSEVIQAVRLQLAEAAAQSAGQSIHFPVEGVELQFQVGVTKSVEAKGGVKFWVLDLGGGGSREAQSMQTISVKLGAPELADGTPLKVSRRSDDEP
jgi:hypothetical protein